MSQRSNFLDSNDNFREQNLRFVQNELEDNINQFFGGASGSSAAIAPPRDSLIVQPTPGFCVKSFKVNSNEKFFINVCQAPEVPAPKDVTEEELIAILDSPEPGSFRVPMSLSEPRNTKDRSDNTAEVCDIAINPKFLMKIKKSPLFSSFFLQIAAEALSEKYNIQIAMNKTIILNTRKFMGNLVAHRVRNDDVKRVNSIAERSGSGAINQVVADGAASKLVQEIDSQELQALQKKRVEIAEDRLASIKKDIFLAKSKEPLYKLRARVRDDVVNEIHAELYLPNCVSSHEVTLDIGVDRILVESMKHGYLFDKFVNYRLRKDRAQALFDKTSKMLQVRIPVMN